MQLWTNSLQDRRNTMAQETSLPNTASAPEKQDLETDTPSPRKPVLLLMRLKGRG